MGDLAEIETMENVAVNELHSGTGDATDRLQRTHKDRKTDLYRTILLIIDKATRCQDDDEHEELVDGVFAVILDAGRPLFSKLISSQEAPAEISKSLHHFLFPPFSHFRLEAPDPTGSVSIIPISSSETYTIHTVVSAFDQGLQEELEICRDLPSYTPEEIVVTEVFERGARTVTAAVQVQERDMFCKASGEPGGLYGTSEGQESLGEILEVFQQNTLQVPRLLGYIHHKDTKQMLGFLRQWVPGRRLSDIITSATAQNKQKWAPQIRQTIESLHQHGLIWADGKISNIIIDEQDNAWLIDFGGGYTRGWVDDKLAETKEGDEQALNKIMELLSRGENVSPS